MPLAEDVRSALYLAIHDRLERLETLLGAARLGDELRADYENQREALRSVKDAMASPTV